MGPALETFLGVLLLIGLAVAGVVMLTRPFWPRIANYFRRWQERDKQLEQRQREEADCRRKAQQEVGELCHDDAGRPQPPAPQPTPLQSSNSGQAAGLANKQACGQTAEQPTVQQVECGK